MHISCNLGRVSCQSEIYPTKQLIANYMAVAELVLLRMKKAFAISYADLSLD
jgi:hypothetical protein